MPTKKFLDFIFFYYAETEKSHLGAQRQEYDWSITQKDGLENEERIIDLKVSQ